MFVSGACFGEGRGKFLDLRGLLRDLALQFRDRIPQGGDFVDYVRKLGEVAEHQGRRLEAGLAADSNAEPGDPAGLTTNSGRALPNDRYRNIAAPDGANPLPDQVVTSDASSGGELENAGAGEPGGRRRKTDSPGAGDLEGTDQLETTVEGPQIAAQGDPTVSPYRRATLKKRRTRGGGTSMAG